MIATNLFKVPQDMQRFEFGLVKTFRFINVRLKIFYFDGTKYLTKCKKNWKKKKKKLKKFKDSNLLIFFKFDMFIFLM